MNYHSIKINDKLVTKRNSCVTKTIKNLREYQKLFVFIKWIDWLFRHL